MNNINPFPATPWDNLSRDEVLIAWQKCKDAVRTAQEAEMEMRKYIVSRQFPDAVEGTNTAELGNGYKLKAVVKYNYKLPDNDKVEEGLKKLEALGNEGAFIGERLISWTPKFLLSEFRTLQEDKEKGSKFASDALSIIYEFLVIEEAAPTLEIKEPKKK